VNQLHININMERRKNYLSAGRRRQRNERREKEGKV
jgi:hypothetical protein